MPAGATVSTGAEPSVTSVTSLPDDGPTARPPAPPRGRDEDPRRSPGALDELRARLQAALAKTAKTAKTPKKENTGPSSSREGREGVDAFDGPMAPMAPMAPRPGEPTGASGEVEPLPFQTEETPLGPLHFRRVQLSPAHRVGRTPVLPGRTCSPELLALLALDSSLAACDGGQALYLDTETTGLAGGTGTVPFLVGLAFWQDREDERGGDGGGGGLVVEQLLVRNLGEEAPVLAHVARRMAQASMLVTFNGKSFDMPLLRTRYVMAQLPPPPALPHLDLVHVARRLHKPRGIECKLTSLERNILGFERVDDVPSSEIGAIYMHYLRTGDTRGLHGVIEHNVWDIVTMAALVGLYGEPLEGTSLHADDLAGVARTFRRAGHLDEAYRVAHEAVERGGGALPLQVRGELHKARGDRERALLDFEALASSVDSPAARLELAKLYEHHVKAPAAALAMVEQGTGERTEEAARRRARLEEKLQKEKQMGLPGLRRRR